MTVSKLINESLELSIAERIQTVEGIWNTIADSKSNINFTSAEINSFEEENYDIDVSGYIGAGFVPVIPFVADIDASVRLHFVRFEDMWVGITVGLNF